MQTLLIILAVIVIGAFIYLASLDGNYTVKRSKLINGPIQSVFDKLRDFKTWSDWSPWLMHEPDTKLEFSDNPSEVGGYYTWDGQRVGAGKLTHVAFDAPRKIEERIEFTRPFKSVCQVSFELAEREGQTEVTWIMQGKMPFLFRFMTQKTAAMIAKDYDLGLAMLAGKLDPNAEHPLITFDGEASFDSQLCLCRGFSGRLEAMQKNMEEGFPKLMAHVEENGGKIAGMPLTAYHKVDEKTMQFECDLAVPITEAIDAGDYQIKTIGSGDGYYKTTLKGGYNFLELAWYAAKSHVRMLKQKLDSSRPSLEVYQNDPRNVANSNEMLTSIYVPVR